jgi:citrate synthase
VEWIDSATAAERLGVKPATLYAYVSRGVLTRRRGPDGRRSLFDARQVEDLAARGRPRAPGPAGPAIESSITALGSGRPYYRGRDALELATAHTFEEVAGWLWAEDLTATDAWTSSTEGRAAAEAAQSGLPPDLLPLDRLQVIVTALAVTDPLRFQLNRDGVIATARGLIAGLVDALPPAPGAAPPAGSSIAERLWTRLCPGPPDPALVKILQAALVLLADHELAASTLAARVAASVQADPYAVVTAGLGVLSGPLHGGASYGAERVLAEIGDPAQASHVIGRHLRDGRRLPGFGHPVHKTGDRRATFLLGLLREAVPDRLDVVDAVFAAAERRKLPAPNTDFTLAALVSTTGMIPGAGEAVFAVARTAGWLAHAIEEYERRNPLRPRAIYTGRPLPDTEADL